MDDVIYVPQYGYDDPDSVCDFCTLENSYEDKDAAKKALVQFAREHFEAEPDDLSEWKLEFALGQISEELKKDGLSKWHTGMSSTSPVLIFRVSAVNVVSKADTTTWYGVEQSKYGHCCQWIFDENTVSKEMYDGGEVVDGDCMDVSWPLTGSNACSTSIVKLDSPKEIEDFLLGTSMCEYEDPSLCDIAEYYKTVEIDHDSSTKFWLNRLNITQKMCEQCDDSEEHFSRAKSMIDALETLKDSVFKDNDSKWDDLYKIDYDDPWYGQSRDVKFSELQDLHQKYCS